MFARVLRDGFALAATDGYAPFAALLQHHLAALVPQERAEGADAVVDSIFEKLPHLPLHGDVEPGLRQLQEAGYRAATLTNGTSELTRAILDRHHLLELVEQTLDVAAVRAWKPRRAPYDYAARQLDLSPERIALVAVHPWDVHGARRAGMFSVWLTRGGERFPEILPAPHLEVSSLSGLADELERA